MYVELVSRWMHILSAIILVGGTIFMRFAYYSESAPEELEKHHAEVRSRWSRLVAGASGFLLLSGIYNLTVALIRYDIAKVYHMAFAIKFILAFVLFFLSASLAGRRTLAQKLRKNEKTWLTVNVLIAVAVVCLAGVMKMAERTPKPAASEGESAGYFAPVAPHTPHSFDKIRTTRVAGQSRPVPQRLSHL